MLNLLISLSFAFAEYRVFELVIRNTETQSEKIVVSTLDPLQYTDYYPVLQKEDVLYRDTWMCYGSTAHKQTCPNPRLEQQRVPASNP